MDENPLLIEFFAVTKSTSVYRVWCKGDDFVGRVEKIFSSKKGILEIGTRLEIGISDFAAGSDFIGIGKVICLYYGPSKKGTPRPVAELVNCNFWGGNTSGIVALFTDEEQAKKCAQVKKLKLYDKRWKKPTEEIKTRIGNYHPRFVLGTGT